MRHVFARQWWLVLVLVLVACATPEESAPQEPTTVQVALSGDEEVPPVATTASGEATVTLDGAVLSVSGSYEGMTATVAHIHGPAAPGVNAGVLFPLDVDAATTSVSGEFTLTEDQLAELADGLYYVNVHSAAYPAGEIRGQIVLPAP